MVRDDDADDRAALDLSAADADSRQEATATDAPEPGTSELALDPSPEHREGVEPGLYVQAGSFRDIANAVDEGERLREEGIDAFIVTASRVTEMLPGFEVLLVGPLTQRRADEVIDALAEAEVEAYERELTPADGGMAPQALAATAWTGTVDQSRFGAPEQRHQREVRITFGSDGTTGGIEFVNDECDADLALDSEDAYSIAYYVAAEYGGCRTGGLWHMRIDTDTLTVASVRAGYDVLMNGNLVPLED